MTTVIPAHCPAPIPPVPSHPKILTHSLRDRFQQNSGKLLEHCREMSGETGKLGTFKMFPAFSQSLPEFYQKQCTVEVMMGTFYVETHDEGRKAKSNLMGSLATYTLPGVPTLTTPNYTDLNNKLQHSKCATPVHLQYTVLAHFGFYWLGTSWSHDWEHCK